MIPNLEIIQFEDMEIEKEEKDNFVVGYEELYPHPEGVKTMADMDDKFGVLKVW